MKPMIRIVGVSDVSIGYGSRQVPAFMDSLRGFYGLAELTLIEPDQPERPPKHDKFPNIKIKRIITLHHPYTTLGRIEYILKAAKEINKVRPEVVVIFCTYSLPVLLKINYRPRFVIYYSYEVISAYGHADVEMNRSAASLIDLLIFPEENRAVKDIQRCGFHGIPKVIIYNCPDIPSFDRPIVPPKERNNKILYAGTIDKDRTYAEYFLRKEMQSVPVDVFGSIEGLQKEELKAEFAKLCGSVRYYGYIDAEELANLMRFYSYSIVIWAPTNENQLYAAPNKFFESIAAGVPPIAAPHPQCKMLINRYKCGILMDDWSFNSFYRAIKQALDLYGTERYDVMVENCRKAFIQELNWEKQFEKVKPFLKEVR